MQARTLCKALCVVAVLVTLAQACAAQQGVRLAPTKKGYRATAPLYTVDVRPDGRLDALSVAQEPFLPPSGRATAGGYLYQKGVLALADLKRAGESTLTAQSDRAVLTYAFDADRIRIEFRNKTADKMTLVLLFAPEVNAAADGAGAFVKAPVNAHWPSSTWYRRAAKLKIDGGTRIWGPFSKDLQVWTLDVEANRTGVATLVPGRASAAEQQRAAGAAPAAAKPAPTQVASKKAFVITKALYEATVSADGCLTSLKVKGEEFLHERGSNPRGAYLFQGGAFGLGTVTRPAPDTVVASGPRAEVTYVFAPESVSWRIRNLTAKKLITLMAFDPAVRAVRDRFGQYEKTPAQFRSETTTWYGKSAKLEVSNGGRIWGPWSDEKLQIWQHDLGPKAEHTTRLKPGLASPEELADVAAALSYVAVPPTDPVGPMWDLAKLGAPPATRPAEGVSEEGVQAIFYDGPPYRGRETRVFAWLGVPNVPTGKKVPGMVLIHGGGGTAFAEWVRLWNARGYAAIAMDTCGSVPGGKPGQRPRHAKGGPAGWGGYGQIDRPRTDQWAYHAIADVILANSLLRAQPQVDPDRIGVTGISWGGYLCSMVAGVDDRFRFAVPVYGCGFTTDHAFAKSVTTLGKERAARWMRWWDPSAYLADAKMPLLWVTGSNDFAYTFNALQKSYRLPKTPRTLCIRIRMPHSHRAGWAPKEIGAFADSMVRGAPPLIRITGQGEADGKAWATFESVSRVVKADLNITRDSGPWQKRKWQTLPAQLGAGKAQADLPPGTTVYYLNLTDDRGLLVSTEHVEVTP